MRMSHDLRKQQILEISAEICKKINYRQLTKKMIARRGRISKSLINYHFKSMRVFRSELIAHACDRKIYHLIAQALIAREPIAIDLPDVIKRKVIKCTLI